jgi:hypothetical protein
MIAAVTPRALRQLVPLEIAAVLVAAWAPLPEQVPAAAALVVIATASRAVRGRGWAEVLHGDRVRVLAGAAAGLVALGLAFVVGTPAIEAATDRAVEWPQFAIVRGSSTQLVTVVLYAALVAAATELALRGWLVERVLEFAPAERALAVLVGAIAEAIVQPGDATMRLGAFAIGIGLGWMYVAGGRSAVAPICARVAFAVGAVLLEALRVV